MTHRTATVGSIKKRRAAKQREMSAPARAHRRHVMALAGLFLVGCAGFIGFAAWVTQW